MRQIFNTLAYTTPEPPCAKQKEALDNARGTLKDKKKQLTIDLAKVANNLASIKSIKDEKLTLYFKKNLI